MWKLFGYGSPSQGQSKDQTNPAEDNLLQLKDQIETKLKQLQRLYHNSETHFEHHYLNQEPEEIITNTFQQLIATIEGLITMVVHLRTEYQLMKDQLQEHHQLKQMMSNHQQIISDIQENHSQQVSSIYQSKSYVQQELRKQIVGLTDTTHNIKKQLQVAMRKLTEKEKENEQLLRLVQNYQNEVSSLRDRTNEAEIKYRSVVQHKDTPQLKKVVNLQHLKLDYLFYYGRIRQKIVSFLGIKDLISIQQTNKFYYFTMKKQLPRNFYQTIKNHFQHRLTREIKDAKNYEKIYQLFPSQNIKINALKYLYFKIKPASYILPYLQEQSHEAAKQDPQIQQKTKSSQRFNWKSLFNSEKILKTDKKEENKFTLSSLKNEEEFKRIEVRIEALFKNILQIKMPEDLQYFSETMENQLQELKTQLGQNKGKGTQAEWMAQIYCLSRYMYHEINELYSLLQVIFGELISKNKELIGLRQCHEYMTENQVVLRNLIENISSDKASIEKKLLVIENDIVKSKLQREATSNTCDRLTSENIALKGKLQSLLSEHGACKQAIERYEQDHKQMQYNLARIRQEIENIQNSSGRMRKDSLGSISSEQQAGHEVPG